MPVCSNAVSTKGPANPLRPPLLYPVLLNHRSRFASMPHIHPPAVIGLRFEVFFLHKLSVIWPVCHFIQRPFLSNDQPRSDVIFFWFGVGSISIALIVSIRFCLFAKKMTHMSKRWNGESHDTMAEGAKDSKKKRPTTPKRLPDQLDFKQASKSGQAVSETECARS